MIKGRSPTMTHVSRIHRVALDWLFDRISLDPQIQVKYVDTQNQLADIPPKDFSRNNEWTHFLWLFRRMNFSLKVREHIVIGAMSKRGQNTTSNPTAKARPVDLVMRSQCKEETSSSSFGSRVNPVNDDRRKRVGHAPGNWMLGDSESEVENSQVSRQEKILQATRKPGHKDQTQIKSEENPPAHMEYTNHRNMDKIFQNSEKL